MTFVRSYSFIITSLLVSIFFLSSTFADSKGLVLKTGDKIAFMGDSITQAGGRKKDGYVNLVMAALKSEV